MRFFDELQTSLKEAVDIKDGDKAPARVTRYEIADVKAIRAQLNVSQTEMAQALGTSVDTIKSWESRRTRGKSAGGDSGEPGTFSRAG